MAMLSSYTTLLSRAPAPALAKSSPAGAVQLRSRQQAAASVAALRWVPCNESRSRAALFACHANNEDASDLINHVLENTDTTKGDNWDIMIMAQKDVMILKLRVGESWTSKEKLKLTTMEDPARLVINIKYISDDNSPASELNAVLTIPPGYDGKKAQGWLLANGWLIITIAKPKNEVKEVDISHTSQAKPESSSEAGLPPALAKPQSSPE